MIEFLKKLLEADFMPHGHCYFWTPEIVWPIAFSNGIIALAYFAIPVALIFIYRKRGDFKYVWMAAIFAVFIFGCGLTHVFDIINIWQPYYRLDTVVRVVTAVASIGAAVVMTKVTPRIVKIPTLEQWERVNKELSEQVQQLREKDMIIEAIRKFEELTDAVPQIMWIFNKKGELVYINNKWEEYTGKILENDPGDPMKLENWKEFIHPDEFDESIKRWREGVKSGKSFEQELRLKDRHGDYQWFLSRAVPVGGDNYKRWFGTFTNINFQKKQNDELLKINTDLDNFVYAASHDLRAPLTNMIGILSLLNDERKNNMITREKEKKFLEMLSVSVEKLRAVIDDLTEISRLQKNIGSRQEDLDIPELVAELESELQDQIEETNAVIQKDFKIEKIRFSRKNMRSVLYNLITNAIKYRSPDRRPEIQVKTYSTKSHNVLEINDNGIGISEKHKEVIFDLFKRLHRDNRGTGVGLFIVKRIIDNAEGKIDVNSKPGVGTSFKICLKK